MRAGILALLLLALPAVVEAEDWPEWRGRGRLGVWNENGIVERFPASGLEFSWRVPVRDGYGGPAVAAGRVFVTDFESMPNTGHGIERLLVLDEKSGQVLWQHTWDVDLAGQSPTYANGPRATPTVDGERVYVLGSAGRLLCLQVDGGEVLWQRDYVKDFGASVPTWGMVGAPLVVGERLIALVGGEPDALVVAFDKRSGKELWRSLETDTEPGYAPPILVERAGVPQLIIWHPTGIAALDPATGNLYWQQPCEVWMGQTIATPVSSGDRLLVSSSSHGSTLLRLHSDHPGAELVWKGNSSSKTNVDGIHAFLSTPHFLGDHIYGIGGLGWLRCIEARTNKEVWKTAEPCEDARIATAFLVRNGDRFFINNDRGDLIIAQLSPSGYQEMSRTHLIEPTTRSRQVRRELGVLNWVHPAYANRHIIQRNDREIVRASLEAR